MREHQPRVFDAAGIRQAGPQDMFAEERHADLTPTLAMRTGYLVAIRGEIDLVVVIIIALVEHPIVVQILGIRPIAALEVHLIALSAVNAAVVVLITLGVVLPVVPFRIVGRTIRA